MLRKVNTKMLLLGLSLFSFALSSEGWGNFLHYHSVITPFELRWSLAGSEALFIPVPAVPMQRVLHKPRTSLLLFPEQRTKFSFPENWSSGEQRDLIQGVVPKKRESSVVAGL